MKSSPVLIYIVNISKIPYKLMVNGSLRMVNEGIQSVMSTTDDGDKRIIMAVASILNQTQILFK